MRLLRRETILRLTHIGTSGRKVGAFGRLAGNTAAIRSWTLGEKSSQSGIMAIGRLTFVSG